MTACPRCDTPLDDDDRCPACSGDEREHDYLTGPEVVVGPCGACGAETSRCEMCAGFVCSACARRMIPACKCDDETLTEADQSAAWGDPRPMPEWRD